MFITNPYRTPVQPHKRWYKRKRFWIPVLVILIPLVIAYIYLEIWATRYVNDVLAHRIHGYRGSVSDVDIHLYRGAYQLHDLKINKLEANIPVPFVDIKLVDLSIQWGALFHGRIVSDIHLNEPVLNFAIGKNGAEQTGKGANWNQAIHDLMPIDINVVTIQDGKISYKDFSASPDVNIDIHNLNGELRNLRNVDDKKKPLPASIDVTGTSVGKGKLALKGDLNVLTDPLDMDIDFKLEKADLTAFNSYMHDFALLDFKKGELSIYSNLVVKKGHLTGYIKPLATNVHVINLKKADNPLQAAWQVVAAFVIEIFTNQSKDQFATQIPLSGNINNPETSTWPAIVAIVRNAFIGAFTHSIRDDLSKAPK